MDFSAGHTKLTSSPCNYNDITPSPSSATKLTIRETWGGGQRTGALPQKANGIYTQGVLFQGGRLHSLTGPRTLQLSIVFPRGKFDRLSAYTVTGRIISRGNFTLTEIYFHAERVVKNFGKCQEWNSICFNGKPLLKQELLLAGRSFFIGYFIRVGSRRGKYLVNRRVTDENSSRIILLRFRLDVNLLKY